MRYLAERELTKNSSSGNANKEKRDIEECIENVKVKEEIEKTFEQDFTSAILGMKIPE